MLKHARFVLRASEYMGCGGMGPRACADACVGEAGARLLHLLDILGVNNVCVVVSRWCAALHPGHPHCTYTACQYPSTSCQVGASCPTILLADRYHLSLPIMHRQVWRSEAGPGPLQAHQQCCADAAVAARLLRAADAMSAEKGRQKVAVGT
jgi:hypothetical protein